MKFMLKVSFPVEAANASARKDGFRGIQTILERQKPEAAYFLSEDGKRTGLLILDLNEASQVTAMSDADVAQPFGINGMMVMVPTKVATEPSAPS